MSLIMPWLLVFAALLPTAAAYAAEIGIASLVEGSARVLRGATWYQLVPGARLEDGDIVDAGERSQMLVEFSAGHVASFVGPGALYFAATPAKGSPAAEPFAVTLPNGWLKVAAKPPGARVRTAPADVATTDGILVIRAAGPTVELFVEAGSARLAEPLSKGREGPGNEAKHGEYWSKSGTGRFATVAHVPRAFVDAMPRHFLDPLPSLAAKFKAKPTLIVDHDITYPEAEPWLAGGERAAFEKRFASRLRDPAFRKAVEPHLARYSSWDRMLHPEKYAPKAVSAQ
jgi:hypothetical protein